MTAEVVATTLALRDEEPPLGLAANEAICPRCRLAFIVAEAAFSWGVCPDCLKDGIREDLEAVPSPAP